jgi:CBS domain-containing protein
MGLKALCKKTPETSPDVTVLDAVHIITEQKAGAIAIMEGRKILGIFTERDLLRRVVALGKDPKTTPIREAMSTPVQSVMDHTPVAKAAALMRRHHIRHLAVLDEHGNLEGIVALRYLLYALMDELGNKVGNLYGYLMVDGAGGD